MISHINNSMKTIYLSLKNSNKLILILGLLLHVTHASFCQFPCTGTQRLKVLPVFIVPAGGITPTSSQKDSLMHYLFWAQTRYFEMMKFRSTFMLADSTPHVYLSSHDDTYYQTNPDVAAAWTDELLNDNNVNRFNCPYIFLTVYMHPTSLFPVGGARPINGGFNLGGGIIILSSYDLDNTPNFESTIQHELGHSFGLCHADVYGKSMSTDSSLMSYNPNHHTSWFTPSPTPGILSPENLRDLSLNKKAFPEFYFDSTLDIPAGYPIYPFVTNLGILYIPNQTPYELYVTTTSGEDGSTHVGNILQHNIKPSYPGMSLTFDPGNMWQSGTVTWAEAEVHFPFMISIDKIGVHSQHSGQYNEADSIMVEIYNAGSYSRILLADLIEVDQYLSFPAVSDSIWKFSFRSGTSGAVTIRGLEFFFNDEAIFPPCVPYTIQNPLLSLLPGIPVLIYPEKDTITTLPQINLTWSGIQSTSYRVQIDTSRDFCSPLVDSILLVTNYDYQIPFSYREYFWRVKGRNNVGQGFNEWSEIWNFKTDFLQGAQDKAINENILIYPNPVTDKLFLNNRDESQIKSVSLLNNTGEVVQEFIINKDYGYIYVPKLSNGIYLIQMDLVSGKIIHKKIVVM
jgi:hypothetical protein